MKNNNDKKNIKRFFEANTKIMVKLFTLILFIFVIVIFIYSYKGYLNDVHNTNITDYNWLNKNVKLEKLDGIYYVDRDDDINVFNDNYRKVIDAKLSSILNEYYTEDRPLVIYNPYGTNKLGFNIYFKSDDAMKAKYVVSVNSKKVEDYEQVLTENYENDHKYQVIGLVPGYENTVKMTFEKENGDKVEKTYRFNLTGVKTNSQTFLDVTEGTSEVSQYNGLFTILGNDSDSTDYVGMYDNNGVLRYETNIIGYRNHKNLIKDGYMYFSISQNKMAKVNSLGQVEKVYSLGKYYLHHDYVFDKDGNILILANDTTGETEEDKIIRLNPETGDVMLLVDMAKLYSNYVDKCQNLTLVRDGEEDGLDWIHLNSIEYVNGDVIVSSRETSTIIKIESINENPRIKYMLTEKELWEGTGYENYIYEQIGNFKPQAGQHDVRYFAGDEDGVYYLTMFDNNYASQVTYPRNTTIYKSLGITNTTLYGGDHSNYYKYKVDENNKTYELVDSFEVPYSAIVSSAQTLDNDNILVDSGVQGIFGEYDKDHNLIKQYKIKLNKYMIYRVYKYSFDGYWFNK